MTFLPNAACWPVRKISGERYTVGDAVHPLYADDCKDLRELVGYSFDHIIPAARLVDSNVIWCGSERYDSASPLDGGDSDDRSDHPFGAIGG